VDQLLLILAAVNRATLSGEVLGAGQKVSVMDALKCSTINAAYQYFEEGKKGSIEPGKPADFVVLSKNPLKIDPLKIKDIQVVESIKEGLSVYMLK
jgi:predicted amidohydrolase YtcJ